MNDEGGAALIYLLAFIIQYGIVAFGVGLWAKRKNRDPWAWGLIGGLFCLPTLVVLAFMSFLCPRCRQSLTNDEWEQRTCPRCGDLAAGAAASPAPPRPPAQAG